MLNKAVSLNRHSRALRSMGNVAQRGLSLIEILFVIVILIIGILTIAQIFPIGFGGLRAAGNTSLAEQMAQQQLDKLRSDPGGVPDGIYAQYIGGVGNATTLLFDPSIRPGRLADYTLNSAGSNTARYNRQMRDINKTRFVSNESFKIAAQRVNVAGAATNPVHVLNFAPVFLPAGLDWSQFISVVSGDWTPKSADSEPDPAQPLVAPTDRPTDYLTPGQPGYLVDYANQRLAVAAQPFAQSFYFQVDVIDTSGARSTKLFPFGLTASTAASGYANQWFPINSAAQAYYVDPVIAANTWPTTANGFTWVVGSARLYRPFTYSSTGISGFVNPVVATDPQDPYQFTLANPNFGLSDVNPGVLTFPASAAQPGIGTAIVAKVSYSTFDWHILHEDRDVSPGANIRLTMHDLKKVGDTSQSGSVYPGLIPNIGAGNDNFDVILLDLDSGQVYTTLTDSSSNDLDATSTGAVPGRVGISYRNGRLTLPTDLTSSHLRIFYATSNDFGVAIQMAPKTYHLVPDLASVISVTDFSTPNRYALESTPFIDFPVCDQGKSIQISGVQYLDSGGVVHSMPAIQLALPAPDPTKNAIRVYLGDYVDAAAPPATIRSISSIVGLSASTIAVWRENGNWKQRSLETTVGRS